MNHSGTITLETARLILRRFRTEDAEQMYHRGNYRQHIGCIHTRRYIGSDAWLLHGYQMVGQRNHAGSRRCGYKIFV